MAKYHRYQRMDQKLDEIAFWVQQLQQRQQFDVHPTREFYEPFQQAYPNRGFLQQSQMQYYPYSQSYNFGWHKHYDLYPYQYNSCYYKQSNLNFSYQVA